MRDLYKKSYKILKKEIEDFQTWTTYISTGVDSLGEASPSKAPGPLYQVCFGQPSVVLWCLGDWAYKGYGAQHRLGRVGT